MSDAKIDGLAAAVSQDADNHAVRILLAEALVQAGRDAEAAPHFNHLLEAEQIPPDGLVAAGRSAIAAGDLQLAARILERAKQGDVVDGVTGLEEQLTGVLGGQRRRVGAGPEGDRDFEAAGLLERAARISFEDVGGLDDVKKTIHRTIILPFQRPDLYARYGRKAGGGVMLYGPPGCGKTLLARATAGECGLPFLNVRIEEILDPYLGVSERNLHTAFEEARSNAPCVLFIDELDAVAYSRRKQSGSAGRPLVDQLLQELDAIGSDNEGLLILSATNAPWDVDDALKRPGRLDRPTFVPPPDKAARSRILEITLSERHMTDVSPKKLAAETALFSGADLIALVESATDLVIDEAIDSGGDPPLTTAHFEQVLPQARPTTLEWLASARNYVEFANQAGRYDDVAAFLRSREAKRLRDMLD